MSGASHTPGPWALGFDHHRTLVRAGDERTGRKVASTFLSDASASIPENEANARLIAAAPELLAVCERMMSDLSASYEPSADTVTRMQAAIAKARGAA